MTDKSNFTPDEWKLLLQSAVAAGIAVTAADPSGLWGLLRRASQAARPWRKPRWTQVPTRSSK
jgi:hypothetical protein